MMTKVGTGLMALGLGAATLTGCGGGSDFADKSAQEIIDASTADMNDLTAVKVSGTITSEGQEIDLDVQANNDGDCTGSITIDGGKTELLGVGGKTWMRPDEVFWRTFAGDGADQVLAIVGDRWVILGEDGDSFQEFCDLDDFLDELLNDEDDDSTYTKAGTAEVDGKDVVKIDSKDEEGTSTGFVLVDEPHYLVKIERTQGEDQGTVTFSEFNEDVDVTAPADNEAIDLDSLG